MGASQHAVAGASTASHRLLGRVNSRGHLRSIHNEEVQQVLNERDAGGITVASQQYTPSEAFAHLARLHQMPNRKILRYERDFIISKTCQQHRCAARAVLRREREMARCPGGTAKYAPRVWTRHGRGSCRQLPKLGGVQLYAYVQYIKYAEGEAATFPLSFLPSSFAQAAPERVT